MHKVGKQLKAASKLLLFDTFCHLTLFFPVEGTLTHVLHMCKEAIHKESNTIYVIPQSLLLDAPSLLLYVLYV